MSRRTDLYRTWALVRGRKRKGKRAVQCTCSICEVQSKCNITPLLGSTSTVTMLVLLHQHPKLGPIDDLNPLKDTSSSHATCTSSQCQLLLPDAVLYLSQLLIIPCQTFLISMIAPYLGHGAPIMELINSVVNFGPKLMTLLKKLELS